MSPKSTPPSQLGDYLRGERIGAGGMGTVYRAQHRSTGADYALKVLRLEQDAETVLRFQREGQALAALSGHPNVVRVHSAGVEQGWLYLVQELVPGGDLQERLRGAPLPPDESRRLAIELGRGLAFAHQHGILHRDLKPANVLIDPEGHPRLVDFGVARVAGSGSLTKTGALLGSPSWMSPEQAQSQPADERSDVYGLGAVLYHCLTGRPPAEGGTLLQVLDQVVSKEPPPPRSLAPDVPPGLEAICLKAIAKRPADRHGSVEELIEDLTEDLETGGEARPRPLALSAVLTALVCVGVAIAVAIATRSTDDPSPPVVNLAATTLPLPVSTPKPKRVESRKLDDPTLWRDARAGSVEAERALGRQLLAAKRPVAAAQWLKRSGAATWKAYRTRIFEQYRAVTSKSKGWDPRKDLALGWILLTPPGLAEPGLEHPRPDPLDRDQAIAILTRLYDRGHYSRHLDRLLRCLKTRQTPKFPPLKTSSDYREAAYLYPILGRYFRAKAYDLGTRKERNSIARAYGDLCWTRFPHDALRIYREVVDDVAAHPQLRAMAYTKVVELAWQGDPDVRDPRVALDYAERGAKEGGGYCAQVWKLLLTERGPLTPALLEELCRTFEAVPVKPEHFRFELADLYLQLPTPRFRDAGKLLLESAPWLRENGTITDLRRGLRLWGKAQRTEAGLAFPLQQARTRHDLIQLMKTVDLLEAR